MRNHLFKELICNKSTLQNFSINKAILYHYPNYYTCLRNKLNS